MTRLLKTQAFLALFLCLSLPVFATAYTWTNGGGDFLWSTAANWAPGTGPPAGGDSVTISTGDTVKLNSSVGSLIGLTVSGGSGITGTNAAGTVAAAESLGVRTTVTLSGGGTIDATITMQATASTTLSCTIANFNGLFKVTNPSTVTLGTAATLSGGSISFSGGGTLTTSNFNISLGGTWSLAGAAAFNVGTSTVTFSGPGAQTVDSGGFSFTNLTKSGSSTLSVLNNQLTVTGTLTTSTATDIVDMGIQNFNLGALSNTGTIALDGIQLMQTITAMDTAKGTVNYYGTSTGTIALLLHTFYNLSISGGGLRVFSLNYLATFVNNLLTITSGSTLTMGTFAGAGPNTVILTVGTAPTSGNLAVTGTLDCTGVAPTSTTGGAYLIMVDGTTTINTGGDIKTGNNTLYLGDGNGLGGSLVMAGGTLDFSGATNTANTTIGTGAISGTGTINAGGQGTIRPQGNVNLSSLTTYTPGQTRFTFAGGVSGTPLLVTTGGQSIASIRIGSGTLAIGSVVKIVDVLNLTGNVSSNGAISCGSNAGGVTSSLDVTGITVTVGAAQAAGGDVDLTATPGAALSTFISTGSTFVFSGTNAQALNSNSLAFNNLQVGATGALTLSASITLTGDLTNNLGGSLNTTANSTTVTFAPTGPSAAYNALHPGLSASPAAMISGNNTFFNFTCNTVPGATLYFSSGNTTTVNGAWTIAGTSGNLVSLLSSNFGSQWTISSAGTSSVSYAYVQDSSVSGANNISPTTSTNAGNNKTAVAPRWIFSAGSLTWVGTTSNNWNVASNWDLGYIPGPQDNVTISGANPAKLFSAVSVNTILITTGTLDLSNFNLPLLASSVAAGSFTLQAGGTLLLDGGQATLTFGSAPVLSGTVEYYGTGTTGLILGNTYVNLEFANAGTWTLNALLNVTGSLTFLAGGPTLNLGGNGLTVGGNLGGTGTLTATASEAISVGGGFTPGSFTAVTSTVTLNGSTSGNLGGLSFYDLVINKAAQADTLTSTGGLTVTNALTMTTGTWLAGAASYTHTIAGAWNSSSGTFTFTAGTSTISMSPTGTPSITTKVPPTDPFYILTLASGGSLGSAVQTNNNLTISGGTLTLNGFALTVGTNLTGAGALTATASEAISVGGNWNVTTFTPSTSTVTFTGASGAGPFTVTSNAQSFSSVVLNAAGKTYQQSGAANITAALTLTAGTWSTNGAGLTVGTNLTGAGALTATASEAISVGGNWNVTTFTPSTSTVTFTGASGAGPFTVTSNAQSFSTVVLNANTKTYQQSGAANITAALTLTAGTWNLNGAGLTVGTNVTGAGALTATASEAINVGGGFTPGSFTAVTSTVTLNGSTSGNLGGLSFYDLVINKAAQADTLTSTGGLTVTNALTMTTGTWLAGAASYTHTIAGAWNSSSGTFTFTAGTSTISMSPTGTPSITTKVPPTDPFYILTLASGGSLGSAVQANNNLTISGGTLTLNGFALTVDGNLTGNALTATASEAISVGGNWNVTTFTPSTSTVTFTGASGAGPFTVTSNAQSFSTVVENAAGKTYQQSGAANITAALTLTAGTWSTNGAGLTVGTNLTGAEALTATASEAISVGGGFTPGSFTAVTSTVTLNGSTSGNLGGLSFYDLVINKAAQADTLTSTGGLTVTNALTMTTGTWLAGAASYTHTIAGAWNSSSGTFTFTAGTSTISMSPTGTPSITTKVPPTDPFYILTLASGGSLGSAVQTNNNLTISGGTLTLNGFALTVGTNLTGAGALTATASEAISVGGNWNVTTFTPSTSTVTFTGASGAGPFTVTSNAQSFSTVVLNAAGKTYQQSGAANITAALTLTAGTWSTNGAGLTVGTNLTGAGALTATASEAISVGGNWNVTTFTPSTSTVTFTGASGAGPFTVTSNAQSFSTVVLNANTKTYQQSGAANITAALTLTAGTWNLNGAGLTVGTNVTGAGALTATASEAINVGGGFTPGSFTAVTSTVTLNGSTSGNLGGLSFYDLVINKAAQADTLTSTGGLTVTNALTMTTGTWLAGAASYTHTIAGAWNSSSGTFTFTAGTSTISMSPTGTPSITTKVPPTDPFYILTLASGGSLGSAVQANNNLTISGGTLTLNGFALTVDGNLTGNALTATASEAISVGGNWNVTTFTPSTSTVTFTGASGAGPFTVTSNAQSFSTVVENAAGKTYQQSGAANITAALTLTAGTWSTNGAGLTVGTNLTGAGALTATASEAISVGGGFTPGSFTAVTSTVTLNGSTSGNLGGLSFYDLVINKAAQADTLTSTGGLTVTNALTMTTGTWLAGAASYTHTIAGAWNSSSGTFTFTAGTSTISLSPTGTPSITTKVPPTDPFYILTLASGGSLGSAVQTNNNLTISAGTLTLNGFALTVSGNLTGAGALTATASEAISVGGNWNITTFTPSTSTVTFTGTGSIQPATAFYVLAVNATGVVTLQANITINNTLTLNGILNAGTFGITMNGTLWNNVGGTFNGGTGMVTFLTAATLTINGNNTWYDFNCTVDSKTILFQHQMTQTIPAGGNFNVHASSPATSIVLTTDNQMAGALNPAYSPPAVIPQYLGQWIITDNSLVAQNINNLVVSYSYATVSITPGSGATDGGHNFGWNFTIPIVASWTLDTNNNGRIDRIRVQVLPTTQLNGAFGGFTVQVNGYVVTGYQGVGINTDVFDILLQEGSQEDTNATPTWQVSANSTLKGLVGGALVAYSTPTTPKLYIAASGARPVITYTLAALGATQAYVHFSEPVYGNNNATAPIGNPSMSYSVAGALTVQPTETTGTSAHAALVTLPAALGVTDLLQPGGQTISAALNSVWSSVYPSTFTYPTNLPPASQTTYPGNPGAYPNTNADGNQYLPASVFAGPPYSGRAMLMATSTPTAVAHNISDVGIGFVTPVLAEDQSITRDPTRGGIGLVTVFDGSKWLPPQNVFLEARIMPPTLSGATVTLFWDINPPAAYDFNNLWLPQGATTLWPGNLSGDRAHTNGDTQARGPTTAVVNGALRDFTISASDPAIKDGALFQFMFLLNDGAGHTLPCAFPADPANPASVRPFEYTLHSVVQQRGGVTITSNVIHPANGESAYLHYTVNASGPVTVIVFDLSGSIVNVLQRGTQSSGEYTTAWDGKNRGGRVVARGIYFIRVVGPGFDEIRKVLVVR